MTYAWVATELLTGHIIEDLPDLDVSSIKQTIGKYESTTATLPLPTAPESWLRATLHGATVYNLLDIENGVCPWGGFITKRPRDSTDVVQVPLATLEAYLDRRYVGDKTYTQVAQNLIVKDLVERFAAQGTNGGIPIRVQIVGGNGALRDRTYENKADKTLFSVLTELSGVEGGPEWTIGWEWLHNPERVTPVLYVGDRLGNPVTDGLDPNAVFDMPGCVVTAELDEDFTSGRGANDFQAVSTADGDVRPESQHVVIADPDRPTFEYRFTPSTSITNISTLDAHARRKSVLMANGTNTLSLSSVVEKAPMLGVDWFIGDDIGYDIGGTDYRYESRISHDVFLDVWTDVFGGTAKVTDTIPFEKVPGFPGGMNGIARTVGWQLDFGQPDIITPIIYSNEEDNQ